MAKPDTATAHNRPILVVVMLYLPGNKESIYPRAQSAKGETGFAADFSSFARSIQRPFSIAARWSGFLQP
jgi:hypothetical protein